MHLLFSICVGLTIGSLAGLAIGFYRNIIKGRKPTAKDQLIAAGMKKFSRFINLLTFILLGIGLIWTLYFLIIGVLEPKQTAYATNVSQLIVSVLTVFSIIIAFYQFLKER